MRSRDRLLVSAGWVLALAVSAAAIVIASCGGPSETPGPSEQAASAIAAAEKALPGAELWDARTGDAVAKPVAREAMSEDAFDAFAAADVSRAAHLDIAKGMGYGKAVAAGRVTYDNGAVMTMAALAGKDAGDVAMLVVGSMPGDGTTPDPPEAVFIARPVHENGKLVRIDFTSERGSLSLDPSTGQVDLGDAKYGSCASWNCLAGAVYFWWEDNSDAMDAYWGTTGELCMDCLVLPLSQPVTCPLCAAFIGAPILASLTNCTIWPCDLCVSDSCHAPEYENRHCVTENGVSVVRRSVTNWHCENPKTQQSECVLGATQTEVLETCQWGCRPGSPTCQFPMECWVSLQNCPSVSTSETYCVGAGDVVSVYQNQRCVGSGNGEWGSCVPIAGDMETYTMPCPYTCADGACQGPPTCDPVTCEQFEKPLGGTSCIVRPDDGKSVIVQQLQPYACVTVQPRTAVPTSWPEGKRCEPATAVTRVVETCPGECTKDGTACAPACTPAACNDTVAGATSCSYDYRRYKRYQQFETKACKPLATGGSSCAVVDTEERAAGLCPWGCTADGSDCAPDTGVPEAPGDFLVAQAPGETQFIWSDNSLDEQGFHIYHGGCSATPARPCTLIATTAASKRQLLLDWQRPAGGDRCWEISAFNATGESAPVWYCLPD